MIQRFLANRFNLAGANDFEKAKADMVCDQLSDLQGFYMKAKYNQPDEETKQKELENFYSGKLIHYMESLEKLLASYGTEFFAGDTMTFADYKVAIYYDRYIDHKRDNVEVDYLDDKNSKYPLIKALTDKVHKSPKIAPWIATRPDTWF